MNIKKTIITATVALTMVAMIAPTVGAATVEELQAQVNALMAQLNTMQGPSTTVSHTYTRNLQVGSTGDDVMWLQKDLNAWGYQVAMSGAGSLGNETVNFGPKTLAAVQKWQTANGITSANRFGPLSRAKANSLVSTSPSTPTAPTTTTGPVSVMLAVNNPASGTVVSPSTGFLFAKYTFTGNGTVTSLKLTRSGVSSNNAVPNVYLYDGATRLTDGASLNSDSTATFNNNAGLFTVSGSKTISIIAEIVSTDTPYSINLSLTSVTSGGVISPVNIAGNLHYVAITTNAATVDFGTITPTAGSIDPAKDVVVFNSSVSIGTREVTFSRLAMRQIGSVNTGDIANFRLMVDGVTVATVENLDSDGYATFVLATPKLLATGTRVVKVLADVNGGSSRTFQFSIRNKTDVGFLDSQYNSGISSTFSSGNFPASPVAATSINSGSVTVQKTSDSPSGNTIVSGNDVVLAKYTLTTYGESLKIENIKAGFTTSDGSIASLRNGRIMINGAQVGSTATLVLAGTTYTTNYTLAAGMPATLEIRADIFDNDGTNHVTAGDTFTGKLVTSTNNTQRLSSLGYITVPAADISGNTLTASSSATITLAATATYAAQTTAVPQTSSYKLASFTLDGNNVEDVNLDTVAVNFTSVTNATFAAADLTDVILKINGVVIGSPKGTVSATGDTYSITKLLVKNGTMNLEIWSTIGSTITAADSIKAEMTVSGVGALSSVASTTATMVDGQVITANAGSITATQDASRPDASINDDNGTKTMAAFKFVAITDAYTLTDLTFTVADVTTSSTMRLFDGITEIAQKAAATTTTFNGLTWVVPSGQTKILTVKLDLGTVGVGAGSTGASTLVTLTAGTATNGAGTSATITESNPAGTAQYTYKSIPALALVSLPTTALVAGTNTLSKFSISTSGTGTVGWERIIFSLTKTSAPTIANGAAFSLWNADSNTQIAGTATVRDTANAATCVATLLTCRLQFVPTIEQQVSGSVNYLLKATVAGTLVTTDYITTSIASPSVFAVSDDYTAVAASGSFAETYAGYGLSPSFIWSDVSGSGHDIASTTVLDWSNDFLVRTLPLDSQTLTK